MKIFQAQRASLAGEIDCQIRHASRRIGASAHDCRLCHGIRALEGDNCGELLAWGVVRLPEISVQHFPFIIDLHALEGRPYQLPGLVKIVARLLIGSQHARIRDRLGPTCVAIETGGPEIVFIRRDLEAVSRELLGHLFVLLCDARPFRNPGLQIKGLHALRHFELIRIARVHRLGQADFQLSASRQTVSGKEFPIGPTAHRALFSAFGTGILCESG